MISAYNSRMKKKSENNQPKSLIYRYISDISMTILKGTHASNKHECRWIFFFFFHFTNISVIITDISGEISPIYRGRSKG